MKWLILVTALFFTACASSNQILFTKTGKWVTFPECVDPVGTKVKWIGVTTKTLIEFNAKAAVALKTKTGHAQILYNKEGFPYLQDGWIKFIQYHECAHHELGHLLPEYKDNGISDEWEADCVAAKKLKEEDVPFARLHLYARMYLKVRSDTHGDVDARIDNMEQCYNAGIAQLVEQRLGKA